MKILTKTAIALLVTVTFIPSLVMAGGGSYGTKSKMDIVDTAVSAGSFNTLAAAP